MKQIDLNPRVGCVAGSDQRVKVFTEMLRGPDGAGWWCGPVWSGVSSLSLSRYLADTPSVPRRESEAQH